MALRIVALRAGLSRTLCGAAILGLAVSFAGVATQASAGTAAVKCPVVNPHTEAVTPPPAPGVNWSGCDLTGADLADADLHGADLARATLNDVNLTGANLSRINLSGAIMAGANFTGTVVTGADLKGAWLAGVRSGSISGTPSALPGRWSLVGGFIVGFNTDLSGDNLAGLDLNGTDLTDAFITGANLSGTQLATAKLTGLHTGGILGTPASLPQHWQLRNGFLLGPGAYISGAALSGTNLAGADLAGAFAEAVDLSGADLAGANLSTVDLDNGNLTGASLANASLDGASLGGANLSMADVSNADMSSAQLGRVISGGITGSPKLPADWQLIGGYLVGPGTSLDQADLAGLDLSRADLAGAVLSHANLTNASLKNADLSNAILGFTNLSGTQLDGSTLTGIYGFDIIGTPASLPENWSLASGFLIGPGADLADANLADANLAGADLANATLAVANLTNADLNNANLTRANLDSATVTGATFAGAIWSATICPDGSNSDKHVAGCFSALDITPPTVTITGVLSGKRYIVGGVPKPGCQTTDDTAVATPARLTVTTTGKHGVGAFTATCSGAVDRAGNEAAPVSARYTVVYGFGGFVEPVPGSTVSKSAGAIKVRFRLTNAAGLVIAGRVAAALAVARAIHVTLRGPGIRAITAACAWKTPSRTFQCLLPMPAHVRTGRSARYSITSAENVGFGFVVAPGVLAAKNPEIIHFK